MDILSDLRWRGLIHQSTDGGRMQSWLSGASRTLYVGFDPTADSLHIGHFLPLMMLRRFQRAGHRPIALVGGATGMIGDPSGRSEERNLLSKDQLRANVEAIESQMRRLLDFDAGSHAARLVNNFEWMSQCGYLDFLRDVGKHFPVNSMIAKDSVKSRLEREDSGLSYTEFSYMLLQAYDFVHLYQHHDCEMQVGGSDQWGNITAGIDLARRLHGVSLQGLTCPLLTKPDGTKMGKTERGALWLSARRTSPYRFYQYWINVADDTVQNCLRYLTDLEQEEVAALDQVQRQAPHQRDSQRKLAEVLTRTVHGAEGLNAARRATDVFFGAEIAHMDETSLLEIFDDVPSTRLPRNSLDKQELTVIDAFVQAGLCRSKGEARRLLQQGGTYLNNRRITDLETQLTTEHLASKNLIVLRKGKNKYALLRLEP